VSDHRYDIKRVRARLLDEGIGDGESGAVQSEGQLADEDRPLREVFPNRKPFDERQALLGKNGSCHDTALH